MWVITIKGRENNITLGINHNGNKLDSSRLGYRHILKMAAIFLTLNLTDTWTRKALKWMDKADIWMENL